MSWLHLNVEQHFQHYQSTPRSQTSTKISSKMVSAHFNFPWQSTLVLPPSSIRLANDYSFRGCGASKERWCCGTHFPGVFLECAVSRGKPFCISDCRRHTILCICSMLASLIHFGPHLLLWVSWGVVPLKSCEPSSELLSLFLSLSLSPLLLSTPSLLFDTNWGSQAENELCVEVSLDKREEADGVVIHLLLCRLPLLSLRRWICFRLRVTEMLCDINHITAAWLNWWWICWWSPKGFGNYDMQLLSTVTLDQSYRFTLLT